MREVDRTVPSTGSPGEERPLLVTRCASLVLSINVRRASDPDALAQVLADAVAEAVDDVPGLLRDPAPIMRSLPAPAGASLTLELVCGVACVLDRYPVEHELRRRIIHTLRCESPRLAFEIRAAVVRSGEEG